MAATEKPRQGNCPMGNRVGRAWGRPAPTTSPRTLGFCCTWLRTASSSISAASSSSDTSVTSGPFSSTAGSNPPSFFPFNSILPFSCWGCMAHWSRPTSASKPGSLPHLKGTTAYLRRREARGNPFQRLVQQHGPQDGPQVTRHDSLLLQAAVVLQGQDDWVGGCLEAPR